MSLSRAALSCGLIVLPLLSPALVSHAAPRHTSGVATVTPALQGATSSVRGSATKATVPAPKAARPFVSRSVAGPRPVKDASGATWSARTVGYGTYNRSDGLAGKDILGTKNDALYRANAWGIKWYWTPVPAQGTYRVRLLMAEDFFADGGRRVFDVVAEGRTVVRGVDIAKAVGRGRAYDVSFPVTVKDGQLDLRFVAKKDNPLISAVEVVSTAPVAVSTLQTTSRRAVPGVRLSPTSYAKQSIRTAPLAPNSSRTVAALAKTVTNNWNGAAAFNAYQFNSTVYTVPSTQRKVRVEFDDCQGKGYTPANLFTGRKQFVDVPVPSDAVPAAGTDGEMTIYDPAADKIWEFWQMRRSPAGRWSACWGGRIDGLSTTQPVFPAPYGATASGLLLGGLQVTPEEIRAGRIDHAIPIAVVDAARWDRFSWPANRSDGASGSTDTVREGQRLRLDPRVDVAALGLTPVGRIVATAAQEYGFIVVDKGGAVAVIAQSGEPERRRTGVDPWDQLIGGESHKVLAGFPWHRLQAIRVDHGRR